MASKTDIGERSLIQQLEKERDALKRGLWRQRRRPSRIAGYSFLAFGALVLALSIIYSSASSAIINALIGLGLIFWGTILLYIAPTRFVRSCLLDSTAVSTLIMVNKMITELNYNGSGIYLPPTYIAGVKGGTVFIPSEKKIIIPPITEVTEERVFHKNPSGLSLPPPGLSLVNLYEEELGKDFARTDLEYVQTNLPKVFIEDLQIAEDLEIEQEDSIVKAKIKGTVYRDLCTAISRLAPRICRSTGCPLCSSIALAIARSTKQPVTIKQTTFSQDNNTIEVTYRLLEKQKPKKSSRTKVEIKATHPWTIANQTWLPLFFSGSAILIWVGYIIFNDIITWQKNLNLIFLGSRIGEAISLGIGMNVAYYVIIGILLLISALATYLLKRGRT
jgi:hypothetical protein